MFRGAWLIASVGFALLSVCPAPACCPVGRRGQPVVNADQTVIILWDAATKTQHFIRKASFKSDGDDFGFVVPTPNQPELAESGNAAFPYLQKLTEPEIIKRKASTGSGCGCGGDSKKAAPAAGGTRPSARVLEEKLVAGFNAVVLEADSADALAKWLKEHDYALSPEVENWAKPYVEQKWKFIALKVAKTKDSSTSKNVDAAALRLTFKTERPLFPYREPKSETAAETLNARSRLLRIYFLADARYQGELTPNDRWTGAVAWADKLAAGDRKKTLELLNLPETTGPAEWWLTEFEDRWPYRVAPADVYFQRDVDQGTKKRPPIIEYVASVWPTDAAVYAFAAVLVVSGLVRRWRRRQA